MPGLWAFARRLAVFVITVLAASVVIFLIAQALPGDVAVATLGIGASPDALASLRAQWGLDQPLIIRYVQWLFGMFRLDFGNSYLSGLPVASLMAPRLGVTAWLIVLSMPLSLAVAVPMGLVAAMLRRRWTGAVVNTASHIGLAIPVFFVGTVLAIVFAVKLRWLPANGYVPIRTSFTGWLAHMILPLLAMVIVQGSFLARYVRAGFIDVLTEDYYRTARASGWTRWRALLRHGMRNMATSLVTVIGVQVASLMVGAILVEQVFVLPGLGSMLVQAVTARDLVIVQDIGMLLVFGVLVINFAVDLAYLVIDPRVSVVSQP